jgi:thymidine phosphorylase
MSKKLAEGLDGLLLDVKTGSGAFMQDMASARELARTMVGIGSSSDVETVALITAMDQPLGREVGNANEIRESVEVLRGAGPDDVTELVFTFGEVMLDLAGIDDGRERLHEAIDTGAGLQKLREVAAAHGGDPAVLEDTSLLPQAPHQATIEAGEGGYVTRCDALVIGLAATRIGAGREQMEDEVDHGVGITVHAKIGDRVSAGDPLATVRYRDESRWVAQRDDLASAWTVETARPTVGDLVVERIDRTQI